MGPLQQLMLAAVAMSATVSAAPTSEPASEVVERSSAAKVCDDATKICYSEYVSPNSISYRIAIPDTATATSSFDIALSIVAPTAIGWAGIAWGGSMSNNPLTLGWPNAATAVVSSREATGHVLPTAYDGASYVTLPSSKTNATHWQLDVICSGCSSWASTHLDPTSAAVSFAYASSATAPTTPASNTSRFSIHNSKGKWSHDLSSAKLANFASIVAAAQKAA